MCLAFLKSLFASKKGASSMVAPFIVAAMAGGGAVSAGAEGGGGDTLIAEFTRVNGSASVAAGSDQIIGHPLKKGDLLPGEEAFVTDSSDVELDASFRLLKAGYADGSYVGVHIMLRDTDINASSSRGYKLKKRTGSYDNTDPATDLTALIAAHDFKVEFSSVTETDSGGTRTHGAGAMLATLAAANVSGRVVKLIANPNCERWQLHAYVKDGSGGAGSADAHLHATWYVTRWRASNGTEKKLFVTCVLSLHEYAVASKKRLDYDAVLKDGSTTLGTYSSVDHPYHSEWATIRPNADIAIARPIASDGTSNTLHTQYDKSYMAACECLVPFNTTRTPDEHTIVAYMPAGGFDVGSDAGGGHTNMGHRMNIDGTGIYNGRAVLSSIYATNALMLQTANAWACERGAAMAGLHVPYHCRVPFGDTPSLPMTLRMNRHDGTFRAKNAWTGDGMQAGVDDYPSKGDDTVSYVDPEGGTGAWSSSINSSHGVPYSGFMWLIDGEDYLHQASADLAVNLTFQAHANSSQQLIPLVCATWTGYPSTPDGAWSGVSQMWSAQERGCGLAAHILRWGTAFRPDNCIEANFLDDLLAHADDYLETSVSYLDAGHIANGLFPGYGDEGYLSQSWHQGINSLFFNLAARHLETDGFVAVANMTANTMLGMWTGNRAQSVTTFHTPLKKSDPFDSSTNPFVDPTHKLVAFTGSMSGDTFSFSGNLAGILNNNDKVVFLDSNTSYGSSTIPTNAVEGTEYFVINVSHGGTTTCQFSDSQGGSVKDLGDAANVTIGIDMLGSDAAIAGTAWNANDWGALNGAGLEAVKARGVTGAAALISGKNTFLAGVDFDTFSGMDLVA